MNEYLVMDIETQKLSTDVPGGWGNIGAFGLAIAVTMHDDGEWESWTEYDTHILIPELYDSPLIVTFNGINFDYEVLRPYDLDPELLYPKSYDILHEMKKVLGHRVSLESVAWATLNKGKSGDGKEAVQWYKDGKLSRVIHYCLSDVEITKQIYEFILKHGFCYYTSLQGVKRPCKLPSTLQETPSPLKNTTRH